MQKGLSGTGNQRRFTLQRKLFLIFFMVILVPLTTSTVLLFRQTTRIAVEGIGSSYVTRLDFFSNKMRLTVDRLYQDMLNIAVDRTVKDMLRSPIELSEQSYLDAFGYLTPVTYNVMVKDNMVHSIHIFSSRCNWMFGNTRHSRRLFLEDLENLDWVRNARAAGRTSRLVLSTSVSDTGSDGEPVIAQYIPLRDEKNSEVYAYLSVNLDITAVRTLLAQEFYTERPRNILIVDGDGNLLSEYPSPVGADALEQLVAAADGAPTGYYVDRVDGERYLITHGYIPAYQWKVLVLTPYREVSGQMSVVTNFAITVFLLALLLSIVIAYVLSVNLLSPLTKLFDAMRQVKEGNLGVTIDERRSDEIGLLYDGFNDMTLSLETLMQDLYQEELAKKDIQLKMMSYQINAHFLYNTLDAIHWIARINNVPKISALVSALANYFRITLSEGKDVIPLSQVVTLAQNYMDIYAIKSDFEVDFTVDIPPELHSLRTLKYIFQPLLENAVNHGIERKGADGAVSLKCRRIGDDLLFAVTDTGAGISPDKLAELQGILRGEETEECGSFALRNINLQIKLYYGPVYGMEIESVLGEYTAVTVRVPAVGDR